VIPSDSIWSSPLALSPSTLLRTCLSKGAFRFANKLYVRSGLCLTSSPAASRCALASRSSSGVLPTLEGDVEEAGCLFRSVRHIIPYRPNGEIMMIAE
jgi:hypothetical protein